MFIQYAKVIVYSPSDEIINAYEAFTYDSRYTDLEFEIKREFEEEPTECQCVIYGVDRAVYNDIKNNTLKNGLQNKYIEIYFNKDNDEELLFSGLIKDVLYDNTGALHTMILLFNENESKFRDLKHTIEMNKGTSLELAMKQISSIYGYDVIYGSQLNPKEYSIGKIAYTGNLAGALSNIVPKNISYFVGDGEVILHQDGKAIDEFYYVLMNDNGLISYPYPKVVKKEKETKTYYVIKAIYVPYVKYGRTIMIPYNEADDYYSPIDTGKYKRYKILKYSQTYSGNKFQTVLECSEVK